MDSQTILDRVHFEVQPTATMEFSHRHGLSDVAIAIAALPGPQYLTEIARLHRFIHAANVSRIE